MMRLLRWFDQSQVVADFINAAILAVVFVAGILFGRLS